MGELKTKGREGVKENQDKYQEIQESAEQSLEERNRNIEIVHSLEGVDDDEKLLLKIAKSRGKKLQIRLLKVRWKPQKAK